LELGAINPGFLEHRLRLLPNQFAILVAILSHSKLKYSTLVFEFPPQTADPMADQCVYLPSNNPLEVHDNLSREGRKLVLVPNTAVKHHPKIKDALLFGLLHHELTHL
jgi:hypothetical protein